MEPGLADATRRVADRWTLQLVAALLDGPLRFTDLSARLDGIAPNTLSSRLSDLEADGLVVSTPYQQRPERFSYHLTEDGLDLRDVIVAIRGWHTRRTTDESPTHATCGGQLQVRWYCPHCHRAVDSPDEPLRWV